MDITPEQLRYLRDQRGLTRDALAEELGDCTASTINKWERGINPIPSWVAEKMLSKLPVTFTVEELGEMYEICREEHCTMTELFQDCVRFRIEQRRAEQKILDPQKFAHFHPAQPLSKVAEDPPKPRKKNGTED